MSKYKIFSLLIIVVAILLGWFVYSTEADGAPGRFDFALGLDLAGGTHLTYVADTSDLAPQDVDEAMRALRDVIERRVNVFGVSEPVVQVERSIFEEDSSTRRLIVELPGVTDVDEAVKQIGETPVLEFRLATDEAMETSQNVFATTSTSSVTELFEATGLSGRQLQGASLQFDSVSGEPTVVLSFNDEGRDLFAEITRENVGRVLAIFLDGVPISTPVIRDEIPNGQAVISGNFTPEGARELVRDLKIGALPVPVELIGTQTIGPSLGEEAVQAGFMAGLVGFGLVIIFLLAWYRLPGLLASLALLFYILVMLSLFKLIPVTLTAAGIAGFILSIGMAVDANILIFERMKEEMNEGRPIRDSITEGFKRAWLSIRDGNISTIITAVILYYATTSLVRGFALVLGLGVLISMLSAISVTRTFLLAIAPDEGDKMKGLFKAGIK